MKSRRLKSKPRTIIKNRVIRIGNKQLCQRTEGNREMSTKEMEKPV